MLATLPDAVLENGTDLGWLKPVGGNFGVAFDPDNVSAPLNGSGLLTIGCDAASIDFGPGEPGFPAVSQSLVRLGGYVPPACDN